MIIKHPAIAARNIDEATKKYQDLLDIQEITRHKFGKARTYETHFKIDGVEHQLCQPWDSEGRFARFIAERGGEGLQHVCYAVNNIEGRCNILGPHKHSEGWVAFLEDRRSGFGTAFMQRYKTDEGPDAGPPMMQHRAAKSLSRGMSVLCCAWGRAAERYGFGIARGLDCIAG
jgi:methylmalonyl-CoA/ethylmalonyl-CoA epimerase